MNKNYTLKELAEIGAKAANSCLPDGVRMCVLNGAPPHHVVARQAFTKAILDAIGYEFPVDEEREAFAKWWATSNLQTFCNAEDAFKAWKAGREELRKAINKPSYSMPPSFGGIALLSSQQVGLTKEQYEAVDACLKQEMKTKEPPWIPWHGGSNPIVGEQTKYEIEIRNGERFTCAANDLRWSHDGSIGDIIAYRILD
jgi:hypothetical protein